MSENHPPAAGPLAPGRVLNSRYRIGEVIGRGGAATVYRAVDEQLGRTVAIKEITTVAPTAAERARLDDEVRLIAGFSHPGLVTLFDIIAIEGSPHSALVMQYIDGVDLGAHLAAGPLPTELVAAIGLDIAAALENVHAAGVMHRDVKPANILLPRERSGAAAATAMLADFGIARLVDTGGVTTTGTIIGTASYLSPEQARGDTLGPATDIYSLGLVILEALTGVRAFPGTAVESAAARLNRDPEIPETVPEAWRALLGAMLARDPAQRPGAGAVHEAISAIATAGPTATRVMPVSLLPTEVLAASPEEKTEILPPAAQPTASVAAPSTRRPGAARRITLVTIAAIALVALVIWGITALSQPPLAEPAVAQSSAPPAESPSPAPTPTLDAIDYPAVDGKLGDRLVDLQRSIEGVTPVETANDLGQRILAITSAAARDDFAAALSSLDELDTVIPDIPLSSGQRDAIESASRDVRHELDAATKGSKPGKGNK